MGKTDSINNRRVDVYVDTIERKEEWVEHAEAAGESLSKFVQQCVEYAIRQGGPDFAELGQESKRIQELEAEVRELEKDVKQKQVVIDKLESELRQLRSAPFVEDGFEGRRQYDEELIEVIQNSQRITGDEILRRLDVDPMETEVVRGINAQLEQLERFGLVESTPKGWRWDG